jgi:hypothetical protein
MKTGSNGSSNFDISCSDMGGWVRAFAAKTGNLPTDFPVYLSVALAEWFREHPRFQLQCVVPIQRDGNTVELHAWYVVHVFQPSKPPE